MNNLKIYILFFSLMLSVPALAQNVTVLHRNVNTNASGLNHSLNRVGDTIKMTSDKQIYRVSFLSHTEKETVEVDLGSMEANIPLYHFSEGRYTVAVYREDYIIAFDIVREKNIPIPNDGVASLEESILRSSLPDDELYKRNLMTRPNREKDTRLANVAPKVDRVKKEREQQERIKREADRAKKDRALADVKMRETKERESREREIREREAKIKKELAQVEANKKRIKDKAIVEAKAKESERQKREIAERTKAEKAKLAKSNSDSSVTYVKREKESNSKEIDVKAVKYNISELENDALDKQSRKEFRKENLRPNGKKYDE